MHMDHSVTIESDYGIRLIHADKDDGISSSKKLMRKWNQLSRLQRTLVYAAVIVTFLVIFLVYSSKNVSSVDVSKTVTQKLVQAKPRNVTLQTQSIVNAVFGDSFERPIFKGPTNPRQIAVVESFQHAWRGYKENAWGHDHLLPVAGEPGDWFNLGLTIVDSLDTAWIMNLKDEFEEGSKWVKEHLRFTRKKDVNFFEVTIRVLGALLANYHFSQDEMFLKKAEDLGDRLMAAFATRSGIPYSDVNLGLKTAHTPDWLRYSTTAEVATVQLEFRELTRITYNPVFEDAASKVSELIHNLPKKKGLVPIFINPDTGQFLNYATITLGARGDSYYEYLLKQWIQTGKSKNYFLEDYMTAIEGVRDHLAKRSSPNKYLFIGELTSGSEKFNPKMDHLTCFLPGTLALGHANGLPDWHMKMAEELLYTCYLTYSVHPTFLAPEITHFNMDEKDNVTRIPRQRFTRRSNASVTSDMYTKSADAHNLLRPEFVESLWYMYQITGNTTYQDWGWQIFQAFEKYAKVPGGYTSLADVRSENPRGPTRDMMESFFLSETLKYLYLLFSEDRRLLDIRKYVINTEAHPLPIHSY